MGSGVRWWHQTYPTTTFVIWIESEVTQPCSQDSFFHGGAFLFAERHPGRGRDFGTILLPSPTLSSIGCTKVFSPPSQHPSTKKKKTSPQALAGIGCLLASSSAGGWACNPRQQLQPGSGTPKFLPSHYAPPQTKSFPTSFGMEVDAYKGLPLN